MTNYPLPTPQMFAVHRRVVVFSRVAGEIIELGQSTSGLLQAIENATLSALQQFADTLEAMDLDELDLEG